MKRLSRIITIALTLGVAATSCYDDQEPPTEYAVTVTSAGNGTARAAVSKGIAGEIVVLTATPDKGYAFLRWTTDTAVLTLADTTVVRSVASFPMPAADVSITAEFAFLYAIEITVGEGGKAVADASEAVEGTKVALTATPQAGYTFREWILGEGLPAVVDTLTKAKAILTMPAADVSITAEFEPVPKEE